MSTRPLLLLSVALAAGCAQKLPATGCRSDSQCGAGARCTSGVCTADARPTAAVRALAPVQEFELVTLDGSASADPDGDLAEHRWSVRAVDAPCAPPEVSDRSAAARVRFGCAGSFEVTLVVNDALGVESEPVRTPVAVQATTGAPLVVTGPDVATDHTCGGTPFLCRTTSLVQLTAAAAAPAGTLRWTVLPPTARPLDASRRVRFLPDEYAAAPRVEIVTDGTAISGDWIFRAEVSDAYGVVGAAHTRVSVRNRPPVVAFAPPAPFEHVFDRAASAFRSEGAVAWDVVDPDGDPVEVSGVWRHVGDGDLAAFDGDFDGTTVFFSLAVPYAVPEDALGLRGGAGLLREIELVALDTNREVGRAAIPVEVGNRPPIPAGGTFDTAVPHRFDAARARYVASVRAGTFVDPDGDPLVDSTGPGLCDTIRVHGDEVTVECGVAYEGVPAAERLVGPRSIPVAPRDPWDRATAVPVRAVEILNSAPVLSGAPDPATRCVAVSTSLWGPSFGEATYQEQPVTFEVSPSTVDPDGDPVRLEPLPVAGGSVNPSGAVCTAAECVPFRFYEPADTHFSTALYPTDRSVLVASDGAARVQLAVSPAWRTALACP